ncbi:uncharacterized protein LOC133799339 [Humulus lupulus]|uniref:uncharacterized protein LOC133799339 n=1 Tax=Humulus lupulus TaxID=3486 RepID=UPI002B417F60|nr:uncharacterized protein LOC133799339 [Humulus lupulus]
MEDDNMENFVSYTNILLLSHEKLMNNNHTDAKADIDNLLAEVHIPSSLFYLSQEIINYGVKMWIDINYNFSVKVNVNIFVDELPIEPPNDDDGNDDGDDDNEYEYENEIDDIAIDFIPTSENSLERLEEVQIKDDPVFCSICLDNILVDSNVTKLPCTHSYHEKCIVK